MIDYEIARRFAQALMNAVAIIVHEEHSDKAEEAESALATAIQELSE